ncbi:hypothetical protein ACOMHN_009063 [Nucella lapillus]
MTLPSMFTVLQSHTDIRPMLWMSWAISMMSSDSRPMVWMSWAISMMSSDRQQAYAVDVLGHLHVVLRQQAHAVDVLGHLHVVLTQTDSRPMLWMSWAISMMSSLRQTAGPCCGCPGPSP